MFQAIAGLLAHKIDRPQHVEMSESPQRTASPIFVVPKAVRRDIEQITGLSPAAFLNACKDYAFEIPGIVQCPVVAHLTSWLIGLGEDPTTVYDCSIADLCDMARKHGGIELAPIIAEPLRAYALWHAGRAIIVMVSVGRGTRIVAVRPYEHGTIDSLIPDPESALRSAKAQGIELSEEEIQSAFAYWFEIRVAEDGALHTLRTPPELVERDACEYRIVATARTGTVKTFTIRLKNELSLKDRANPELMLEHRHDVMHQALEHCEGLGCTLYFFLSSDKAAAPAAEWVLEPSIVTNVADTD